MHYEAYRDLIQGLEAKAARDPQGYAWRVAGFGALGYAYIVAVAAGLVTLIWALQRITHGHGALYMIKLGLVLAPVGLLVFRILIVRVPVPGGVRLERARAPALFALIDEVAGSLKAPRPDRVLLTADYNCSIVQRPRLGILGWPENVLVLGLPMLETLSRAQIRSVLAHELGHLAAHHSTLAGRLHAVSDVWGRLLDNLAARPNVLLRVFEVFFRWYGPRFQAMGFVLGRRQEYFADQCARRIAGLRATRSALVRIAVMARHHQQVMEQMVGARLRRESAPPEGLIRAVAQAMRHGPDAKTARAWIAEAMRAETGYEHTHPALRDRLSALERGVAPTLEDALPESDTTAAQELLGATLDALAREIGAMWIAEVAPAWKARHEQLASAARTASEFEEKGSEPATPEVAWQALAARLEVDGGNGAAERLAAFVEANPDHVPARFRLGVTLLEDGQAEGLEHLERAMALDTDAIPGGCQLAVDYLRAQGRGREAEEFTRRAWEFAELSRKADEERSILGKKDQLGSHALSPDVVRELRERLSQESWIDSVYLARKQVRLRPEKPCHVLGIALNRTWYKFADPDQERRKAVALLDEVVPPGIRMFLLDGDLGWARARMAAIDGALIWSRSKRGGEGTTEMKKAA